MPEGRNPELAALKDFLKTRLFAFKLPKEKFIVDELPKSPQSKI
jgi:hypothetical protein